MARVTTEDCATKVPNRFNLVMLAAQRARNISAGAQLTVERDNDKNAVVALREIAEGAIDLGEIENALVHGLQKHVEVDEPEDEDKSSDFTAINGEIGEMAAPGETSEEDDLDEGEELDADDGEEDAVAED